MSKPKYFEVFTIIERKDDEDDFWLRIGTAFENKDGSLNVLLNAFPVNAKLHIREPKKKKRRDDD